jgi:phosphatidylglycerol---prolipoprotein diacylglyceryl transferase
MSIYGFIIGIALIVGIELSRRTIKDLSFKDILLVLTLTLIGARALFILHNLDEVADSTISIFALSDGGLAFYGALVGLLLSLIIISKLKGIKVFKVTDSVLLFLPLIQSIGRLGNYFNHELYGYPSNLFWAIYIPLERRVSGFEQYTHFHPVFLYESILNLISFFFLLYISCRYKHKGLITALYLINYSIIRLIINRLRIDKEYILFIETSDLFSVIFLIVGITILIKILYKR